MRPRTAAYPDVLALYNRTCNLLYWLGSSSAYRLSLSSVASASYPRDLPSLTRAPAHSLTHALAALAADGVFPSPTTTTNRRRHLSMHSSVYVKHRSVSVSECPRRSSCVVLERESGRYLVASRVRRGTWGIRRRRCGGPRSGEERSRSGERPLLDHRTCSP